MFAPRRPTQPPRDLPRRVHPFAVTFHHFQHPPPISQRFSMERSVDPLSHKSEPCAVAGERPVSPSPDRKETPDRTEILTLRIALQKAASKHSDQIPFRESPIQLVPNQDIFESLLVKLRTSQKHLYPGYTEGHAQTMQP